MPIGPFGRVRLFTVLVFAAVALTLTGCFQTAGDAILPTPVNLSAIATATNTLAPSLTATPFVTALPTTGFATPTDLPTDSAPTETPPDVSAPTQADSAEPPSLTPTVELPTNTADSSSGGLQTPVPTNGAQANLAGPTNLPTATTAPTSSDNSGFLATPTALATEGPCVHTVQPNEWMSLIARNYNVSLEALEAANTQYNPNTLAPGDVLVIPNCANGTVMPTGQATSLSTGLPTSLPTATGPVGSGETVQSTPTMYTVVSGDTLFGLAAKYGTTVDAIKQANSLTSDALSIGQQLIIP